MIVNGAHIADDIYTELGTHTLRLGILVGEANPVIESFVRIKGRAAKRLGIELVRAELPERADTVDAIHALQTLASGCDGVIVQLPLPARIDAEQVIAAIPPEKDVDGIAPQSKTVAPVARAVLEILERNGIHLAGKRMVVIGNGRLVGAPTAKLLTERGALVTTITLEGGSLDSLHNADVIVCGAGSPAFVKPTHIQEGVVLIDAGTSEQGGAVRGDADPSCAEKAALFTPVPGGVGPVAVAMIFKNLIELAEK